MNFIIISFSLVIFAAFPLSANARDYSSMYSATELQQANSRYSPNIRGILFEDIAGYLTNRELKILKRTHLQQPWNRTIDPFEFSANPTTGDMLIPTFSVKFFDDISVAIAWFERNNCNKSAVYDYVAALDYSTRKLPAPHLALNIPDQAYKLDSFVDDVSQKKLKSAVAFILLHELGHIYFNHSSYEGISALQAQAQETQADLFAMRVLRRMRLPPLGMIVWFTAISMRDPLAPGSTLQKHPLTSARLQAIANDLRTHPDDFIEFANKGRITEQDIRNIAAEIESVVRILEKPDLRSFLQERGRRATPELLSSACNPGYEKSWLQMFSPH